VNARSVAVLARAARDAGACVVHYSTDYVFDGTKATPWEESDPTSPLSVYGKTKLEGEQALAGAGVPYLVLRTSWLYGTRGANFLRTMLRLARTRDELAIVSDQWGAPTWSRVVASTTAAILARGGRDLVGHVGRHRGVYHVTASGRTSWHGFARAILDRDPRRSEQTAKSVRPIATAEYPTPARRPANSVLSNDKAQRAFGVAQMPWEDQLELAMKGDST
jgi:dTDP-4-dehydrorhamnose reductase